MRISFEDLCMTFDGRMIIEDFSFEIPSGTRCLFSGPSGCGKSTLLNAIPGFIRPESGQIKLGQTCVLPENIDVVRRSIAYVPQIPIAETGKVADIMARPFGYKANRSIRDNLQQLPSYLHRLQLDPRILQEDMQTLSGGERQRLAIIAALLLARPVLLLDEPTSALDDENRARVVEILSTLNGITILAAGHALETLPFADQHVELPDHA